MTQWRVHCIYLRRFVFSACLHPHVVRNDISQRASCVSSQAQHPKVIVTPHVAGVTEPSYQTMSDIVAEEVRSCSCIVSWGRAPAYQTM